VSNITEIVNKIKDKIKSENPDLFKKIDKQASEEDIENLSKSLGLPIPNDLKEFLMALDGILIKKSLISVYGCKVIANEYPYCLEPDFCDYDEDELINTPKIKKVLFDKHWILIAVTNDDTDYICYDCSPGTGGTKGQIINISTVEVSRDVIFKNLHDFLEEYLKIAIKRDTFSQKHNEKNEDNSKKPSWWHW
jgi:cell wall assembly regulator SMI1